MAAQQPKKTVPIKIKDEVAGGAYANNMMVSHTREEFVMDFIYIFPQQGVVNARVITSPGHMKRIIRALQDNVSKFEAQYGAIVENTSAEAQPDLDLN